MTIKFWWRCEGTTLSGTDDYSDGDTTAASNGTISISNTAERIGTNGILTTAGPSYYAFNSAGIPNAAEGSVMVAVNFRTAVPANGTVLALRDGANDNWIRLDLSGDEAEISIKSGGGTPVLLTTSGVNLAPDTWYIFIGRWNSSNSRAIEVYNNSNALINATEDIATSFNAPVTLDSANGIRIGALDADFVDPVWLDQVAISDSYNEPLQSNLSITTFQDYNDTPSAFDTSPTVQSVSSTAYTISYNANATATDIYLGAYPKDASAPSAAQIKAGTNAHGTATEATTGSDDTIVLTPSDNPPFPLYDIYAVLEGPGGFSNVVVLSDEFLDPTAGFQFVIIDVPFGAEEDSILEGASPAAADGDIIRCSTLTSPGEYAVEMDPDGVFSFNPGIDSSRQSIVAHFYDVSAQAYSDAAPVTFWVNNVPPEYSGPNDSILIEKDVAITPIDIDAFFWTDLEDDELVVIITSGLPTGLSESSEIITGTPTVYGETSVTLRATDITGDFSEENITIVVCPAVPNVVGMTISNATSAIESVANLNVATPITQINSNIYPQGVVISQEPAAGLLIHPDGEISLTESLGPTDPIKIGYPRVS